METVLIVLTFIGTFLGLLFSFKTYSKKKTWNYVARRPMVPPPTEKDMDELFGVGEVLGSARTDSKK